MVVVATPRQMLLQSERREDLDLKPKKAKNVEVAQQRSTTARRVSSFVVDSRLSDVPIIRVKHQRVFLLLLDQDQRVERENATVASAPS